jgi:hypothetical protein
MKPFVILTRYVFNLILGLTQNELPRGRPRGINKKDIVDPSAASCGELNPKEIKF